MKYKYIYILLVTLLVTNAIMLFMLVKKPHQLPLKSPRNFLVEKLNLNEEQTAKFFTLDKEHKVNMVFLDEEIRKLKKDMFNKLSSEEVIDASITLQIGTLVAKRENEIFSFFRKIKTICREEQIITLERIIDNAIMPKKGRGHGPNDMPPPPRGREGGMPPPPHLRN